MEEIVMMVIVAIGYAISHAVKGKKQSKAKKPNLSGTPRPAVSQPKTQPVSAVPPLKKAEVPPVKEAEPATAQMAPVQQIFPGAIPATGVQIPAQNVPPARKASKTAKKPQEPVAAAAVPEEPATPLPHPESPPHTQGGEGNEGPGMHPCLSYENSARVLRSRLQVSALRMREAVVTTEILDKPVSLRRRWNQR